MKNLTFKTAMLNDSQPTVNRRSTDGQSQRHCKQTPLSKRWKVLMTLVFLFTLAIGNVWGDETYTLVDSNGDLTGDFYATNTGTDADVTIEGKTFKKKYSMGSSLSSLGNYLNQGGNKSIEYDCKSTAVTFNIYCTGGKWTVSKLEEDATSFVQVQAESSSSNTNRKITVNVTGLTKKTRFFFFAQSSTGTVYQIEAIESGSHFPQVGEDGFGVSLVDTRFANYSSSNKKGYIDGLYIVNTKDCKYKNNSTSPVIKVAGTDYVQFVPKNNTKIKVKFSTSGKLYLNTSNNTTEATELTSKSEYVVTGGTTYYLVPNGKDVTIDSIWFVAAATKYDVNFAAGNHGSGTMSALQYEEGDEVTLPACTFTAESGYEFNGWSSEDVTISNNKFEMPDDDVTITATWRQETTKYAVSYALNGASGDAPTETDKAKDDEFVLAGAPEYEGYHFEGWLCNIDGVTYAASANYTMTAAPTTFTAQWKPYATATFADATYIIGQGTLNMAPKFSSNSDGAVTYALKEASANASITAAGVFSATVAGSYVVVANQAATATYAATSKEATVTVLDNELTDLFIWKNGTGFGGDDKCVSSNAANGAKNANQNQASTALNYSSSTLTGMTSIGRPSEAGNVTLTFAVTNAYSSLFGIKSICAFGKIEEPAGIEYSWNNTDWTAIAGGESDDKKYEFTAPAGTFPTSLYIRFTNAVAGEGGLWLRNALVTLQAKKTVASTVVTLNNVMVNTEAISSANLSSLLTNKSLAITTEYAAAPTVTFVKRTTVNYVGGWAADVTDEEIDVIASDASTVWSASQEIGENTYTITLAKPSEPSLETAATGFTLTSTKNATAQETFTFSGLNLDHNVAISLVSEVAGMSVSPAVVTPVAGAITDEEVTISYKSLENVAEANVNLIVSYSETVKLTIPLTYSSTKGWDTPNNVTGSITWDFSKATSSAVTISNSVLTVLANYNVENDPTKIVTDNLAGKGEQFQSSNLRTFYLQFTTTVNGKLSMDYSNTGSSTRPKRYFFVNGVRYGVGSDNNTKVIGDPVYVPAGLITLEAKIDPQDPTIDEADWEYQNLQLYKMVFTETHDITFVDGGSIAAIHAVDGETVSLPAVDPSDVPTGKLFIGWYIGEDKVGDAGDDYTMGNADVEMTAKFSTPAETPVINAQPVGSAYCAGSEPTLTVGVNAVSDGGTLHYAWYKKGETDTKVGADAASYTVESAGTYYVKVTNSKAGSADATVTSENAVVTLNAGAEITAQPAALQVVSAGDAVELSVTATNATGYQWYKGGVLIEGAEAATYNFTAAVGAATYYCVVTGACGDVQSNNAVVYVESGDCNTIGYDDTDNTFGTSGTEYTVGSYTKYKYSKSANTYTIDEVSVTAYKLDGKFYFWTPNTEIAAISTSVLTDGTTPLRYCVVFYDEAKFEPADEHIISVVEETAGLKNAAQKINVTVAPAGAKCARVVRSITWNETSYGQGGNNYIYAARVCAIVPAEKPVISGDLSDLAVCALNTDALTVTVNDVSDGGTLSYQWYNADGDVAITGEESASYTPTAEGTYYVIVTNTLAGSPSSSTKSAEAEVTQKTATAITGFVNASGNVDDEKTLSVTAEGDGVISYQWQACDENGNVTNPAVLGTEETYGVTITEAKQYYLVTVHSGCGADVTQVLFAEKWTASTPKTVDGSMTWNWESSAWNAVGGNIEFANGSVEELMANVTYQGRHVPNVDGENGFRSDMLYGTGTYVWRPNNKFFQGTQIRFITTTPGRLYVTYRNTGGDEPTRHIEVVNNDVTLPADGTSTAKNWKRTNAIFVRAGEVIINCIASEENGATRIKLLEFDATPDYERDVTEGRYGTICLPNGGVMAGASIYTLAYYGETSQKIFFDEVVDGTMEAGKPYLFLPNEGINRIGVFYTDNENESAKTVNGFVGYIGASEDPNDALPVPAGDGNYIVQNNQYREILAGATAYILSHRAYIHFAGINTSEPAKAPGARRIGISGAPQVATGIDALNTAEAPVKVMIDGQLFILRGEKMYDATGRLVK